MEKGEEYTVQDIYDALHEQERQIKTTHTTPNAALDDDIEWLQKRMGEGCFREGRFYSAISNIISCITPSNLEEQYRKTYEDYRRGFSDGQKMAALRNTETKEKNHDK